MRWIIRVLFGKVFQIYRALYGDAMLLSTNMGTNMAAVKVTETSLTELRHVEINTLVEQELFSSQKTE